MDPVLPSRIQFAFTVEFHDIFSPLSIGLGVILVVMEGMYLRTKRPIHEEMTRFWVKVFALLFAMGVANSWQQTPAGCHLVGEGVNLRAEITDF